MDLQNNLIRRAITIAVNKAIGNMQSSPERSSRNLLDLGLFFTKSKRLGNFFEAAQKILSNPKNSYHQLIKRVLETVNLETVKTVGINLGFNSLNYGAKKIRTKQENIDHLLPWLIAFKISEDYSNFIEQIKSHINDGQELGIYSYIITSESAQALPEIVTIAEHYTDCVFMLLLSPQQITREYAALLSKPKNLVVSITLNEQLAYKDACRNAFQQLREFACFYGFHIEFTKDNATKISSEDFLHTMISHGCAYGSYLVGLEDDEEHKKALEAFVFSERQGHGEPILAFDWLRDTDYVGNAVLPGSDYLILDSAGQAALGHQPGKLQVKGSLREIIQAIMPKNV